MDILSIISGGLTGLVGSVVSAWTNYKTQQLKNQHEQTMAKIEQDTIKIEAEANVKVTQAQTEGNIAISETEAFKESMSAISQNLFDKSYMDRLMESKYTAWIGAVLSLMFGFVDFLTRLARPIITYYLIGVSTYLTILVYGIIKSMSVPISTEQAYTLFSQVLTMILYLTSTTISWWFCDRQISKFAAKVFGK